MMYGSQHESFKALDRFPKVWQIYCPGSLLVRQKKSQKRMMILIIISLLTRKFEVITCENNSGYMLYILNELAFNGESILDEVRQRFWD